MEKGLGQIADQNNTQTTRLVELVKENGELQLEVKRTLEKQVMQNIIDVVVSSDRDGHFTLAPQETEMLKARLQNMQGIKFNATNFDNMIASDENELTVTDVMNILRNLLDDEVKEEDNVFVLDPGSLRNRSRGGVLGLLPF